MSHIRDPKIIFDRMLSKKIRLFQVFDGDKKSIIDESDAEDDLTPEEAVKQLEECLNNVEGIVYVVIRVDGQSRKRQAASESAEVSKMDTYKGIYKYTLKLGEEVQKGGSGFSMGGNMNFILQLMQENNKKEIQLISQKFEMEKQFDQRLNELEKKLEKKKGGDSESFEKNMLETLQAILSRVKQ